MCVFASIPVYRGLRAGISVAPQEIGPLNRIGLWFGRQRFADNLVPAPWRWIAQAAILLLAGLVWICIVLL